MTSNNAIMKDEDLMMDVLTSEKSLANNYSTFANECSTPEVLKDMLMLMQDGHKLQSQVWTEINERGWYPTTPAEQKKINQAKTKFESMVSSSANA